MEKQDKSKGEEKKSKDEIKPWAVDLIAVVFILRGLVNLLYPFFFGSPFDEYYEFLGNVYNIILNLSSIVVGFGIYKRTRWGYFSGLIVAGFSFVTEADPNYVERLSGRILSIICFLGLMKTKKFFPQEKMFDKVVVGFFAAIILGSAVYGIMGPSREEIYESIIQDAVSKRDISKCSAYRLPNLWKDSCREKVAIAVKNPELCKLIVHNSYKEECYIGMAGIFGDMKFCEGMTNLDVTDSLDRCRKGVAITKKDPTICKEIEAEFLKSECYAQLGELLCDPSLCEKITHDYPKEDCYVAVGKCTGNISYCKKHRLYPIRDECINYVLNQTSH